MKKRKIRYLMMNYGEREALSEKILVSAFIMNVGSYRSSKRKSVASRGWIK